MDVSNWTGPLSARSLNAWKAAGIGLVIVQAVNPPPGYPPGVTRQQCQAVLDAGLVLDAYFYHWIDNLDRLKRELGLLDGLKVRTIWLDEEDVSASWPPSYVVEQIHLAHEVLDTFPTTLARQSGDYTGGWWWQPYTNNSRDFADRPWWPSQYDGIPLAEDVVTYGGWQTAAIKQYVGSSTLAGVGEVDLNIVSAAEADTL